MIQVNLLPDVKVELIRAERRRNVAVSLVTLTVIAAIGLTVLGSIYVFGVQTVRSSSSDKTIKEEFQKLSNVPGLEAALTIQQQLDSVAEVKNETPVTSRLVTYVDQVLDDVEEANDESYRMTLTNFNLDTKENVLLIEARTPGGYKALEALKKTFRDTKVQYGGGEDRETVSLVNAVSDGEQSSGQDEDGRNSLQFTLILEYNPEVQSFTSKNPRLVLPSSRNVTDSNETVNRNQAGDES